MPPKCHAIFAIDLGFLKRLHSGGDFNPKQGEAFLHHDPCGVGQCQSGVFKLDGFGLPDGAFGVESVEEFA